MHSQEFISIRKDLGKTQKQMAQLLGASIKAVQGYEQGWRSVPTHIERHLYFLFSRAKGRQMRLSCWDVKKCPTKRKKQCPAWEFRAGKLCWFINGTICEGKIQKDWKAKMKICRQCDVLTPLIEHRS